MESIDLNYVLALNNIENVCRICFLEEGCISLLATAEHNQVEVNIQKVYEAYANTEVHESDGLPQYLCNKCFMRLLKTNDFITKCKRSASLLESAKFLWEQKPEIEETTFYKPNEPLKQIAEESITIADESGKKLETNNYLSSTLKLSNIINSFEDKSSIEVATPIQTSNYLTSTNLLPNIISFKKACSVCEKVCESKYALKCHMLSHRKEKIVECDTCSKKFTNLSNLKRHLISHTGRKPFLCNICGKTFPEFKDLKRHMQYHDGTYCCTFCDKKFVEKSHLTIHLQIHTNSESSYICSVCNECFFDAAALRKHKGVHR